MRSEKKQPIGFTVLLFVLILVMVSSAVTFSPKARQFPLLIGIPTLIMLAFVIVIELFPQLKMIKLLEVGLETLWAPGSRDKTSGLPAASEVEDDLRRVWVIVGWLTLLVGLVYVVGFLVAIPIFVLAFFMVTVRLNWLRAVLFTALFWVLLYLVFHTALQVELWPGVIPEIIPGILGGGIEPPL
jgi:hypothetical protein